MTLRVLKGSFVVCLALAAVAGNAQAGQYHVYTCRTPSGASAPADGWSGSVALGSAPDDYTLNTCGEGGALIAALGDQTTHIAATDLATWAFEVPAGEGLAGLTLWRAGYLHGRVGEKATYEFWLAGQPETDFFDECVYTLACSGQGDTAQPLSSANRVAVPAANLSPHVYVNASCGFSSPNECGDLFGDPNGFAAAVYLYAADLILEQGGSPAAGNVGGELASVPVVRGTSDVTFTATDPGSGVYEAVFSVDGKVVQASVVNDNGGRCRDVGQTTDGLAAFLYVRPCLPSVSADVPFNSAAVPNGSHHLIVSVLDAAGNAAPVLDRQINVSNPPAPGVPGPPNGTNAAAQAKLTASWKGTSRTRITRGYGSSETVAGRLTGPGGVPISGALIDVVTTPAYVGSRSVTMAGPRTGKDGRFSVRLRGGTTSRTLVLAYRSHLGDAQPAATRTLALQVRAGITMTVAPHTASVGRSIFFHGRLLGGPIPAGGKQLVLEARSPGGPWIEFDVIRTGARGRYRASYRFKFPGPAEYQFRARSEPESDFPFAAGSSNAVGVHER